MAGRAEIGKRVEEGGDCSISVHQWKNFNSLRKASTVVLKGGLISFRQLGGGQRCFKKQGEKQESEEPG